MRRHRLQITAGAGQYPLDLCLCNRHSAATDNGPLTTDIPQKNGRRRPFLKSRRRFVRAAVARKPNSVSNPPEGELEAIISLGHLLPGASSDLPAEVVRLSPHAPWAKATPAYLVLLTVGFTLPLELPPARCALTAPFHPYRSGFPPRRYLF